MKQKIAIPVVNDVLSSHFGHSQHFFVADVENNRVVQTNTIVPPPHEPGVIPKWLNENQVDVVLVGGIGQKAINLFKQMGIEPVIGVPSMSPSWLIEEYLSGALEAGINQCNH